MRIALSSIYLVFGLLAFAIPIGQAAEFGPVGPEGQRLRGQAWSLPSPVEGRSMPAVLFRPPGEGPFRLAIISHGSDEAARSRRRMTLSEFPALTSWLVKQNYAVLIPLRPGHGGAGGPYLESQGPCAGADFIRAGDGTARSISAAAQYMASLDFIDADNVVAIGNSAGGWGSLAYGSARPPGLRAVVNFSGGRGGREGNRPGHNCSPERLVEAAAHFGATIDVPTLWLYGENDTFFPPHLSRKMAEAFTRAGGHAEYHLLPAVRGDGHALINTEGPEASWKPVLASFLRKLR